MNRKFISNSNYVFRKILNSEESLSILKNFIEAILRRIKKLFTRRQKPPAWHTLPPDEEDRKKDGYKRN